MSKHRIRVTGVRRPSVDIERLVAGLLLLVAEIEAQDGAASTEEGGES